MKSLGERLAPHLPLLRRFARAVCGSQSYGDNCVRVTLERLVESSDIFPADVDERVGLFKVFIDTWTSIDATMPGDTDLADDREAIADARLAMIGKRSRQALLLVDMEGFSHADVAYLLGTGTDDVVSLVKEARAEIEAQLKTQVLIIEDEPIIAMDLEGIVRDLGHDVTGIAVTRDEAVAHAVEHSPGLVLADIQLADDSSGIDAVQDILQTIDVPVIFITAFPERLLTGERPEPAFLITKPFQHETVKAAIAQALFFNQSTVPA